MTYFVTGVTPGPKPGSSDIWTPERKAEVKRMALDKLTYSKIGKVMGVSRCAIGGIIGRMKDVGDFPHLVYQKVRLKPQPLHKPNSVRVNGNNNLSAARLPSTDERLLRPAKGRGKTIDKLGQAQCHFATGFNKDGLHIFCAGKTDGGSWCPGHAARVYKKAGAE